MSRFLLITLCGVLASALTACGPAQSATENAAPAALHGEPMLAAKTGPAVTPASAVPATPAAAPGNSAGEILTLGFDKLASYNFVMLDDPVTNAAPGADKADEQIPAAVKAFDRKRVSVKGFMLPLKVEAGVVKEFLLMKDQSMCCYGNMPKITEWISVKSKGVKPIMDQPVSVEGRLRVGALRENGYLVGLYEMDGERLIEPAVK